MDEVTRRQAMRVTAMSGLVAAGATAAHAAHDGPGGGPFRFSEHGAGTAVALPFLPYADFQAFARRSGSALTNAKMTKVKGKFAEDTFRVGALALPDGKAIYANLASTGGKDGEGELAVYTEIGAYRVVATLEDRDGTHYYRAGIYKGDVEIVAIEWKVALVHASATTINGGGTISDLRVTFPDDQAVDAETKSCFTSCLRRHAPDCVAICLQFGKAACIACAGGSIACCWINCHC